MKSKIKNWLTRYGPAEFIAIMGAVVGGLFINMTSDNPILTALGGTWGENIGYYGTIVSRDIIRLRNKHKKITTAILIRLLRNLVLEFGPGEYLDSFLVRPFTMYFFPLVLHNLTLGLIIGKFAADLIFYIPTIISYELRNKFLRE